MSPSQMYDMTPKTVNPLAGACWDPRYGHGCKYCNVRCGKMWKFSRFFREKYSGPLRVHEPDLQKRPPRSDKPVFVCSQTDLFCYTVNDQDILRVLDWLKTRPENIYLLQSKDPTAMCFFSWAFPPNVITATTIESNRDFQGMTLAPPILDRLTLFKSIKALKKMITIEPVLDFDLPEFVELLQKASPDIIHIGAESKHPPGTFPEPAPEKVRDLVELIRKKMPATELKLKSNLDRLYANDHPASGNSGCEPPAAAAGPEMG